ncbi:MAG: YceI family protein [Bacteroidetes bacterium]|nr:YceI family protein [Bacteroidota bacterium]
MKLIIIIVLFFGSISILGQSNNSITYLDFGLLSKSSIEFKGESTINTFNFRSESLKGNGAFIIDNFLKDSSYIAEISVDIESFDSGSDLMNSDMYDALKYEDYPLINFKLIKINNIEESNSVKKIFNADIKGVLTVGGKSNKMDIIFEIVMLSDSTFYLKGNKSISMPDFNIDPPSKLFGLIQVDDTLIIYFNLYVKFKKIFFFNSNLSILK